MELTQCCIKDAYIEVGDVVQFKTLEEIIDEFGDYDEKGVIPTTVIHYGFNKRMEHLCGKVFTIQSIHHKGDCVTFRSVENVEAEPTRSSGHWIISDDMIKPYNEPSEVNISEGDFLNVLLGE